MLTWLRLRSRVRQVAVEHVAPEAAGGGDHVSLFAVIYAGFRLKADKTSLFSGHSHLETVGFAAGWRATLHGRPRRYTKIDHATQDKSAQLTRSKSARCLAQVHIREWLA